MVLAVFMLVNVTIQILWISYAPITGPAAELYGVSDLQIGLLAMTFMIAFIPLSIPASWMIDTYGFRVAVGIGVALMGVFGLAARVRRRPATRSCSARRSASPSPSRSCSTPGPPSPRSGSPSSGRATAVGLVTLANLVGTAIGMALTPVLIESMSIPTVQLIYGARGGGQRGGVPGAGAREAADAARRARVARSRALAFDGLKHALTVRPFWLMLAVALIGLGIFNGINTWIENIIRPRGFTPTDAGRWAR